MNIASRMRQRRVALGLSQEDLARKSGISLGGIRGYERGQMPKADYLLALSQSLECTTDWLLTGEGPMMRFEHSVAPPDLPQAPSAGRLASPPPPQVEEDDEDEFDIEEMRSNEFWALWSRYINEEADRRGWVRYEIIKRFPEFVDWAKKMWELDRQNELERSQVVGE